MSCFVARLKKLLGRFLEHGISPSSVAHASRRRVVGGLLCFLSCGVQDGDLMILEMMSQK